jgi:hypothetical protein
LDFKLKLPKFRMWGGKDEKKFFTL